MTDELGPNSPAEIRCFSCQTAQPNCESRYPKACGNSCASALTIWARHPCLSPARTCTRRAQRHRPDRKSTRLNSSHVEISYAVFCLKKKKKKTNAVYHQKHNKQQKTTQ